MPFGIYIWPTKYRYTELRTGGNTLPVRMNRFTGVTEVFAGKWISDSESRVLVENEARPKPVGPVALPPEALADLQLSWSDGAVAGSDETMAFTLYNGSAFDLESLVVEVSQVLREDSGKPDPSASSHNTPPIEPDADGKIINAEEFSIVIQDALGLRRIPELAKPRRYQLKKRQYTPAGPFQTSHWQADLGFKIGGARFDIRIVSARGWPADSAH